jgi:hypothetical protein
MLAGAGSRPQRPNIDGIPPARANSIEDGREIVELRIDGREMNHAGQSTYPGCDLLEKILEKSDNAS